MRRLLPYLLFFSVLTGCVDPLQKEEEGDAIQFGTAQVQGVLVKAPEDDFTPVSALMDKNSTIGVFGSWIRNDGDTPEQIFKHQVVTCQQANSPTNWTYAPLQYWRKSGSYKFCAVYPGTSECEYGSGPERLVIKYSMHAEPYDLMAAKATVAIDAGHPHPERVPLEFHHACAAVRFLFRNGVEEESGTQYWLNSFELQNISSLGIFIYDSQREISRSDWYPADARASSVFSWEATSPTERIAIPKTYYEYAVANNHWYYVIPQEIKTVGISEPAVHFSVTVNSNTVSSTPVHTKISLVTNSQTTWEPGYLYTYCIRIQRSEVSITLEVEPWDVYSVVSNDIIFGNE